MDESSSTIDSVLEALPRLGIVLLVAITGWYLADWVGDQLTKRSKVSKHSARGQVLARLISWILYAVVLSIAITWAVPSVSIGDLATGFGFLSVGIGFAFRDILENTMSGLILLYRRPFVIGDQLNFNDHEGTVTEVTVRTTGIRQYNGEKVYIPNRDLYKGQFRVLTNLDRRRIEFIVGIAYTEDLPRVTRVIEEAVVDVEGVETDPAPEAFARELAASAISIQVRVWGPAFQDDFLRTQDGLIKAVKARLDEENMEMPCNIVALQATDSFRSALYDREVSPAGSNLAPTG